MTHLHYRLRFFLNTRLLCYFRNTSYHLFFKEKKEKVVVYRDRPNDDAIAVIGMSCRMPGGCNTPEAFFEAITEGRDFITRFPKTRTHMAEASKKDKVYTDKGSFVENVDWFDNEKFGISEQEAKHMDPQQRILLETIFETDFDKDKVKRTGIYVGCCASDWNRLIARNTALIPSPYSGTGASNAILSNRISYIFGFEGPSMTVDTACSSSLVAMDLAVNALLLGQCDQAIVAGVNLNLTYDSYATFCAANMLSRKGRCATFSSEADGYARGEGCGVLVLKRLENANASKDRIHCIIKGTAVNQDGISANLTSPSRIAQEKCIQAALDRSGISSEDIQYVETHGTGTPLGDPIEIAALYNCLRPTQPVILGAVKTNIGHTEGAAGIAGVIKSIMCLKTGKIPANLHCKKLNEEIIKYSDKFIFPSNPMSNEHLTYAGVSTFGFGGTNAHAILEGVKDINVAGRCNTIDVEWKRKQFGWLQASSEDTDHILDNAIFYTKYVPAGMMEDSLWDLDIHSFSIFGNLNTTGARVVPINSNLIS